MSVQHVFRRSNRTPEETARLKADRARYQREKKPPDQLLAEGGHFIPLGEYLASRSAVRAHRAWEAAPGEVWYLPVAWLQPGGAPPGYYEIRPQADIPLVVERKEPDA